MAPPTTKVVLPAWTCTMPPSGQARVQVAPAAVAVIEQKADGLDPSLASLLSFRS
jgi:hypothetical protein